MMHKVLVSSLVLALLAPRLSADDATGVVQAVQAAPTQESSHPYKWPGLIMIGIGGLISVTAMQGTAGVEGPGFRECQADAAQRGVTDDCRSTRATNPSLAGLGVGLMAGGVLIALQRPARSPHIAIGYKRFSMSGRVSF